MMRLQLQNGGYTGNYCTYKMWVRNKALHKLFIPNVPMAEPFWNLYRTVLGTVLSTNKIAYYKINYGLPQRPDPPSILLSCSVQLLIVPVRNYLITSLVNSFCKNSKLMVPEATRDSNADTKPLQILIRVRRLIREQS
jgi:hypothetical protein